MSGFANNNKHITSNNSSYNGSNNNNKDESKRVRSNSSAELRAHLKLNYVLTPDISDNVSLYDYIRFARNLYFGAVDAVVKQQPPDLKLGYIEFYKFVIFAADKLPKHAQYQKSRVPKAVECRKWIAQALPSAISHLEKIVILMDEEEDFNQKHKRELDLINAFDEEDEEEEKKKQQQENIENDVFGAGTEPLIPSPDIGLLNTTTATAATTTTSTTSYPSSSSTTSSTDNANAADVSARLSILRANNNYNNNNDAMSDTAYGAYTANMMESGQLARHYSLPDITYTLDDDRIHDGGGASSSSSSSGADDVVSFGSFVSVTSVDLQILRCIGDFNRFNVPPPTTSIVEMTFGSRAAATSYSFYQDDFHVSFAGFLTAHVPPELQMSRAVQETNRCFFIHVGLSVNIHPFALQCAFRALAAESDETMKGTDHDWARELVSTFNSYAGLVDANALCFLWPTEFNRFRFCFISGPINNPIVAVFSPPAAECTVAAQDLIDVVIRCNGSHFTLWRPISGPRGTFSAGFKVIDQLVADGRQSQQNIIVQESEAQPTHGRSIVKQLSMLLST